MANTRAVGDAIANAEPVRPGGAGGKGRDPDAPAQWSGIGLPEGCPVRAVGLQKTTCIILDSLGQLIEAGPRELGQAHLSSYFAGDVDYLSIWWPYFNADGLWKRDKFKPENCQRSIQTACAEAGLWADFEKVRGRGAWPDPDGNLILHCGDVLVTTSGLRKPDIHDGFVYPAGAPMMRPLARSKGLRPAHDPASAGPTLLRLFKTWNWRRPGLDPRLYLGSLVSSFLGGALPWRPSSWVTGEAGSGKTTLTDLRRDTCGNWSFNAEDASEAGISTIIGFDSIGVSLDEQENSTDNRRLDAIVKLMRGAASGSLKVRGSSSHTAHAFRSRNVFSASSINPAPIRAQDMSRMARLELDLLPKDAVKPTWSAHQAQGWGAELLRRVVDQWPRFKATLEAYQRDLAAIGHDQRARDTFGVLLACADLVLAEDCLLESGADPDRNAIWAALEPSAMPEYAERTPSWQSCLNHLLSSRPREWKIPGPSSIGGLCAEVLQGKETGDKDMPTLKEANRMLALVGCVLTYPTSGPFTLKLCLGVSNQHPGLAPIFDATDWRGEASTTGGWALALGRGPPSMVKRGERFRVDGVQGRGVLVRLDQVVSWKPDPDPGTGPRPDPGERVSA
jgi:hypothetical protein